VSHYAGAYERSLEIVVAGVRLRAPMMNIHTIAVGGGSICKFDGARLRIRRCKPRTRQLWAWRPLTITDCNVMVGKLQPEIFPRDSDPTAANP
jgi:5-oxoprolinase (ATP-hydrolysing)